MARTPDTSLYRPGKIWVMREDQCRFIPGDDHVCCGAKRRDDSTAYCERHHTLTHQVKADPHLQKIAPMVKP